MATWTPIPVFAIQDISCLWRLGHRFRVSRWSWRPISNVMLISGTLTRSVRMIRDTISRWPVCVRSRSPGVITLHPTCPIRRPRGAVAPINKTFPLFVPKYFNPIDPTLDFPNYFFWFIAQIMWSAQANIVTSLLGGEVESVNFQNILGRWKARLARWWGPGTSPQIETKGRKEDPRCAHSSFGLDSAVILQYFDGNWAKVHTGKSIMIRSSCRPKISSPLGTIFWLKPPKITLRLQGGRTWGPAAVFNFESHFARIPQRPPKLTNPQSLPVAQAVAFICNVLSPEISIIHIIIIMMTILLVMMMIRSTPTPGKEQGRPDIDQTCWHPWGQSHPCHQLFVITTITSHIIVIIITIITITSHHHHHHPHRHGWGQSQAWQSSSPPWRLHPTLSLTFSFSSSFSSSFSFSFSSSFSWGLCLDINGLGLNDTVCWASGWHVDDCVLILKPSAGDDIVNKCLPSVNHLMLRRRWGVENSLEDDSDDCEQMSGPCQLADAPALGRWLWAVGDTDDLVKISLWLKSHIMYTLQKRNDYISQCHWWASQNISLLEVPIKKMVLMMRSMNLGHSLSSSSSKYV